MLEREKKSKTMVTVLEDHIQTSLNNQSLLTVGGSTGITDNCLSDYFYSVVSVDIDKPPIVKAKNNFKKDNLNFQTGDALKVPYRLYGASCQH